MNIIPPSELILNPDGSVYHLKLLPEDITETIITVGDPDRVAMVSRYFDSIETKKQKREFTSHIGTLNKKRIMVISTGIGTGNIDILMNELDALVNVNLKSRSLKKERKSLNIVRLGTAGCLQKSVPLGSLVISSFGMGLDGLLSFYAHENSKEEADIKTPFYPKYSLKTQKHQH
jgi:uridine phosphorylase